MRFEVNFKNNETVANEIKERMELLGFDKEYIDNYIKGNELDIVDFDELTQSDCKDKVVKGLNEHIEYMKDMGMTPYYAIIQNSVLGVMYSFFYISKYEEDWELDREDIIENCPCCAVFSDATFGGCDIGSIGIKRIVSHKDGKTIMLTRVW